MNVVRQERAGSPSRLGLVAIGIAASTVASFTTPFSRGAETVTAVALVAGAAVLVLRLRGGSLPGPPLPPEQVRAPLTRLALVWLGLAATTVGWELYCYFAAPRSAHPTLSVLIDMLTSSQAGKGVAFFGWLALGYVMIAL